MTVCVEEGVDFWSGEVAEDQGLTVELGPAVQRPHTNSREVCSVRVFGLEVKVGEQVLYMWGVCVYVLEIK